MADINITVDSSQVRSTKQELQELGNSFNSASKSASIFEQAFARAAKQSQRDEQYIKATSQALRNLIDNNMKIINAYKSAEQSASAFTQELRKQEAQAVKTASANQAAINKQLGVSGPSAVSQGAGGSAMEAEIERLRMKYDQVYASSNLYEKSLAELSRAHMLGVTSTKQHEAAVESLNLEYQSFQNGVAQVGNRFTQHVNQSASGMNNLGVAAQQTGYQVSDFIVQVQGGTNPLVAFSQQATQLAGLLYLLPPALQNARIGVAAFSISLSTAFAGITILIPLLSMMAMAFFNSGKESEDASKKIDKQAQAYDNLINRVEELRLQRQMETSGVETQEEQIIQNELSRLLQERVAIQERLNNLEYAGGNARGASLKQQAEAQRELVQTDLDKNKAAIDAISYEMKLGVAARNRANDTKESYREQFQTEQRLKQAHADQVAYMGKTRQESDNFVASLKSAYIQLGNSKLIATGLANEMTRAASASFAMAQQRLAAGGLVYSGRGGNPSKVNQQGGAFVYEGPTLDSNNMPVISGGGGGAEPSESMLEKFQKQLDIEKELLNTTETYQRVRTALGEEFLTTNPLIIEGLMQQAEEIKKLTRLEEDRQSIMDTVQSSFETGFMDMVKGTKTVSDAFRTMAASIIEELFRVLVVKRIVGSYDSGTGIGSGIMGAVGKAFGLASGGSMMSGQPYLVGEQGPEIVVPRHSGTVVNANQTAGAMAGSGGITVQNNITVTGSDAAMVRQEVAKMIPQITNATKAAVIDAKQRGGQMAAAFR